MRRRDFVIGLLLAAATSAASAQQQRVQQRRIAIVEVNSVGSIDDPGSRLWQAFWEQLRRLGDVEGQNLAVARYCVEGRSDRNVEVAREVPRWNPDVIVAVTNHIAQAVHAAKKTTAIVLIGGSVIADGIEAVRKLVQIRACRSGTAPGPGPEPMNTRLPMGSQACVHGFRARVPAPAPRNDVVFGFPDMRESGGQGRAQGVVPGCRFLAGATMLAVRLGCDFDVR